MKFQGFSRIIPALATMFAHRAEAEAPPPVLHTLHVGTSGGVSSSPLFIPAAVQTNNPHFNPRRSQKGKRKDLRRRLAAGFKF